MPDKEIVILAYKRGVPLVGILGIGQEGFELAEVKGVEISFINVLHRCADCPHQCKVRRNKQIIQLKNFLESPHHAFIGGNASLE